MTDWKDYSHHVRLAQRRWVRGLLIFLGSSALVLGVVGIFVPVLPTVPFILLASICYARASVRFYNWLMNHRYFGPPLLEWQRTKALPVHVKVFAITLIILSAGFSIIFLIRPTWVKVVVGSVCSGVIVYLLRIPTRR